MWLADSLMDTANPVSISPIPVTITQPQIAPVPITVTDQPIVLPSGVTPDPGSPSWSAALADIVKSGLTAYGQIQLTNLQANLIKQGKPPLTAAQVSAMAPQLNVGIAPDTQNTIMKVALFGGIGLIAIMMLGYATKGKRS